MREIILPDKISLICNGGEYKHQTYQQEDMDNLSLK
jgi:hypothetical protein